jgi:hypothetical protein
MAENDGALASVSASCNVFRTSAMCGCEDAGGAPVFRRKGAESDIGEQVSWSGAILVISAWHDTTNLRGSSWGGMT